MQRPLWASTSTKNPDYPDVLYVDNLIGPYTVNTLPLATIEATIDHANVSCTITLDLEDARAQLKSLRSLGIDLNQVTADLQKAGVESFAKSFHSLLASIADRASDLQPTS